MLEVKQLNILDLEGRELIKDVSFTLNNHDKLAIIGEEGNGKSTLLKAIYNKELISHYTKISGEINTHHLLVGYVPQFIEERWYQSTIDEFLLKKQPDDDINYESYNLLSKIAPMMTLLKLDIQQFEPTQVIETLSGGEKVKLMILKTLINEPDILLLDEPTNDLDINTLLWLENFLLQYFNPIIFISHDETLLENTANMILHIEQIKRKTKARHQFEKNDYKSYIERRKRALLKQEQVAKSERRDYKEKMEHWQQIYEKTNHQQNQAVRNPTQGRLLKKKMRVLKTQKKKLDTTSFTDFVDVEESIFMKFHLDKELPSGKTIIDFYKDQIRIGSKILSKDIHLLIKGKEKVVITGNNGCGKSTLMKEIVKDLNNRDDLSIGYMPQNYKDILSIYQKPLDYLMEGFVNEDEGWIRNYLGSMKFTSDEMKTDIIDLSSGQQAKLFLVKLMIDQCQVLVLDEPTRNLSPLSNPILRQALIEFNGTIISISHDRKYIAEVCTTQYHMDEFGLSKVDY